MPARRPPTYYLWLRGTRQSKPLITDNVTKQSAPIKWHESLWYALLLLPRVPLLLPATNSCFVPMTTRRKWRPSSFQYLQVEKDFWRIKKVHKNFHSLNELTVKSLFITEAKHSKTSPGCMLGGWWPSTFELKSCLWPRSDFDTSHRLVWS